jgi:hypothetical protein
MPLVLLKMILTSTALLSKELIRDRQASWLQCLRLMCDMTKSTQLKICSKIQELEWILVPYIFLCSEKNSKMKICKHIHLYVLISIYLSNPSIS